MIKILIITILLCMDGFIVMMEKGATLNKLDNKSIIKYAAIFGLVNGISFCLGYLLTDKALINMISTKILFFIGGLCLINEGCILLGFGIKRKKFVEKLDKDFDDRKCLRLAIFTSIDTLVAGLAMGAIGTTAPILFLACWACFICFIMIIIALKVGYSYGAKFQKALACFEGAGIILFAVVNLIGVFKW